MMMAMVLLAPKLMPLLLLLYWGLWVAKDIIRCPLSLSLSFVFAIFSLPVCTLYNFCYYYYSRLPLLIFWSSQLLAFFSLPPPSFFSSLCEIQPLWVQKRLYAKARVLFFDYFLFSPFPSVFLLFSIITMS